MRVHHPHIFDMRIKPARHALARLGDHRLAHVDADDLGREPVVTKPKPGADTDFQDAAADLHGGRRRAAAAAQEDRTTDLVAKPAPSARKPSHDIAIKIGTWGALVAAWISSQDVGKMKHRSICCSDSLLLRRRAPRLLAIRFDRFERRPGMRPNYDLEMAVGVLGDGRAAFDPISTIDIADAEVLGE